MLESLDTLTSLFDTIVVPVLLVELVVLLRVRALDWPRGKEMLANGVTFLLLIPAAVVGALVWVPIFDAVGALVPGSLPVTWWSIALAVLVADLIYYWEHRISHGRRLLWDLYHSVHHSSPRFDQTTSLRIGIFDGLLTIAFSLPMVALGFSTEMAFAATALVIAYQGWIHTELIDRMPRWFEAVFNTPSHHRAHHGNEHPYLDVNYGGILIVWDRLFGTFQPEGERPIYGLTEQIESSNPLDIQFSQLRRLWAELRTDRSWRTRWRRLWNRPGWQPTDAAVRSAP
ncbi:MAG: sterol desaturase family protein [Actinomycetota bacterium]